MKKIFTLICTLMGLASVADAAKIEDVALCKHSYVLVCDEVTNNGTARPGAGTLFGNNMFLDVTGGSVSTSKKTSDPAEKIKDAEGNEVYRYGEEFATKYGELGAHKNCLRIKNDQDVLAMKVTAGAKLIFLMEGNNKTGKEARYPKIATDAALKNALNAAPTEDFAETTSAGFKYEWTSKDDQTIYIGSYNGDAFIAYIIVEAVEPVGTPTFKVGPQTYEDGLWFREVTVNATQAEAESGMVNTIITYATDGQEPNEESAVYEKPIKIYKNDVLKLQAYLDVMEDGKIYDATQKLVNADNVVFVDFSFDAPTITANAGDVKIESKYDNAKNYVSYMDKKDEETNSITLTESATVSAYTKITNGSHTVFTSMSASKDAYVLNPIKEEKVITVTAGVAKDSLDAKEQTVYYVEDGAIAADKMDFFVKNIEFGVVTSKVDSIKQFQIDGKECYIKMNNTSISFLVAAGDSVDVEVVCSKNSCKDVFNDEKDSKTNLFKNRPCYVNVSGTTYGTDDITNGDFKNLEGYNNVIKFGLKAADADQIFTFQKYSGTGNILISSIKITPAKEEVVSDPHDLCLKVTNPEIKAESYGTQLFYSLKERLVTGTDYVMTMDVKFEKEQKEGLGFWPYFNPLDADAKTQYTGFGSEPYAANEWITLTCNFNAQADHMFLQFPLGHIDGTMYIDNVCLVAKGSEINLVENGTFDEAVELVTFSDYGKEANVELGKWWTWSWAAPTVEYAGIEEITFVTKSSKAQKMLINGKLVIKTAKGNFNAAGILVK